jgi:hypothetical protein
MEKSHIYDNSTKYEIGVYLKVFELYVQKLNKELDVFWPRYKLFLTLNTAAVAVMGFLFKPGRLSLSRSI